MTASFNSSSTNFYRIELISDITDKEEVKVNWKSEVLGQRAALERQRNYSSQTYFTRNRPSKSDYYLTIDELNEVYWKISQQISDVLKNV